MNALPLRSVPAAPEALPGAPVEEPPALAVAGARAPRLRVLIAGDTYPPDVNGAAHFTHRLATGLAARGGQVHVVCASPEGPARTETGDGVAVHRMRSAP